LNRVKDIVDAVSEGRINTTSFRKVPSQASTAGVWCDLSMASGNPSPNFYSGNELTATHFDGNKGIYKGSGEFLFEIMAQTSGANATPSTLMLCDYLMFYPQIDMDSVDQQFTDNTLTLPRYASGEGVMMFVVAQYPYIGGVDFNITYTNSNGVSGRTTGLIRCNTATNIASFIHSGSFANSFGAFLPLQLGDIGVRSVEDITFLSPNGGLGAIVLVKPLYNTMLRELTSPVEANCFKDSALMPKLESGAYLNLLCLPNASIAGVPISGILKTIW
jgi:hypothetical protein